MKEIPADIWVEGLLTLGVDVAALQECHNSDLIYKVDGPHRSISVECPDFPLIKRSFTAVIPPEYDLTQEVTGQRIGRSLALKMFSEVHAQHIASIILGRKVNELLISLRETAR